jgi:hypothetical protein
MISPLLTSYLDESADKERKEVLCVGGILINENILRHIQPAWDACLNTAEIAYFSYSDCKGLNEEFFPYRDKYKDGAHDKAATALENFENILISAPWVGFGLAVISSDYAGVLRDRPAASVFFRESPTESAYGQIMCEIAREVRKNAKGHQVAYFIDDSSDYPKIADVFRSIKINQPVLGTTMVSVGPLDDKQTPALQMADLVVGMTRAAFMNWIARGRPNTPILEHKWWDHIEATWIWDRAHMLRNLRTTLNSSRLRKGTIAVRPLPEPSSAALRRQEKARRKKLVKARNDKKS